MASISNSGQISESRDTSNLLNLVSFGFEVRLEPDINDVANFKPTTLGRVHGTRIVVEQRRQPAFGFLQRPALAAGIILNLVAFDLAHAEIAAFGMGIIKARHR